jgi:hypothetical protein
MRRLPIVVEQSRSIRLSLNPMRKEDLSTYSKGEAQKP